MANVTAPSSHSPSPTPGMPERDTSPTPFDSQANSINLMDDVLHLQEEMNDAMVHLFTARASTDTHCQRIISETEVSHHQNKKINLAEAIREVKARYATMISDAKSAYVTAMRKVEAAHSASTSKAEVIYTTGIRKEEAANVVQASKLQWQHQEAMQNQKEEALEVEKHSCQSFLQACGVALQACPNEALGKLMYPLHLLTGSLSLPGLLRATSPLTIRSIDPIPSPCHPSRSATAVCSPRAKQHCSPEHKAELVHPGEPPLQWWREEDPLVGHLGDSHHEAFCKDVDLVQHIRQTYFRTHLPSFYKEATYKLTNIFREMAEMADLLGSKVHLVQDKWKGRKELHSANYEVRGSAKDLHYFRIVSPLNSPKIMGLWGIHSPEALKHQAGLSFCL